jgi:hypothetical protein
VYYFALSDYPNISDWELKKLIIFIDYEKKHKRKTNILCDDKNIMDKINYALNNQNLFLSVMPPKIITECTACKQKGCITDFFCHTSSVDDAISIFNSGKLLSAVNARNKTEIELSKEPRNAALDPPDFFNFIMFAWGNCQAGDRLVMERFLGKFPNEDDLSIGFKPGIRFYFKYDTIINHKNYVNDGYHPATIKDELILMDNLYCCIIPKNHKTTMLNSIKTEFFDKTYYLDNNCKDIWDWSEKVYNFVCEL